MRTLIVSFSGREGGNCDRIAAYIASEGDKIVCFRDMDAHPCAGCGYECFEGPCKYRSDGVYELYGEMLRYDRVFLVVPMYGGHPAALYFIFQERGQDWFSHNDAYERFIARLYVVGVYGGAASSPDFIPCLAKWFDGSPYRDRVLGIERHKYGQRLRDCVLDEEQVRLDLDVFLLRAKQMADVRLGVRTAETVKIYFERAGRPEIKAVLPQKATSAEEALEDYRKTLLPGADSYGKIILADGVYVGDIWCYCIDKDQEPNAMLSYCVFESACWSRGIAAKAVHLFLREARERYGIRTVGAFTFSENIASIRVLEKNGFILMEEFMEDGKYSKYFQRALS